jgi:virulence-associated protein VagC
MATTARLFRNGRSQAVRLPRELRFEGDRVRVRRVGRGVLMEPLFTNVSAWFAELDRFGLSPSCPTVVVNRRPPCGTCPDDEVPA